MDGFTPLRTGQYEIRSMLLWIFYRNREFISIQQAMAPKLKKIIPHLWFDREAAEAADFYVALFPESEILSQTLIPDTPSGPVEIVNFSLSGNPFIALSAGPAFRFNESVSFMVFCADQKEIDHYWENLSAGGQEQACGWLKDRYGLSWQIIPERLGELMSTGSPEQKARVNAAMLKMVKLNIRMLEEAHAGL
jgi:predicted 3-demethylubiquinone-9 3-methyltransferase (glyoxalase superfamily)